MAGRRCAEWRFPTIKQQRIEDAAKRIAEAQRRREVVDDEESWWDAVLSDLHLRIPPHHRAPTIRFPVSVFSIFAIIQQLPAAVAST